MTPKAQTYIEEIQSRAVLVGKLEQLSVARHTQDLERADKDPEGFPFWYDPKAANRAVTFIELLKHSKGAEWAGKRLSLSPWQHFQICSLFGWKRKDGTRRFRKAYIQVARKNGKSTLAAGLGNYMFVADGEPGAEVYVVATKREQALIVHKEAELQVRNEPTLARFVQIYKNNLHVLATGSKFVPLSSDYNTLDGSNPHCWIVDEYHAHPNAELYEVGETGMGARTQPLLFVITTAGFDVNSACHQEYERCRRILEGTTPDERTFVQIFQLDELDDWTHPENWRKANPNLGISVNTDFVAEQVAEAIQSPRKQNQVKTKNLNMWTQSAKRWISDEKWMECAGPEYNEADLVGRPCFLAFDLSSSQDITAVLLDFPPIAPGDPHLVIPRFFIPGDDIAEKARVDKVPYDVWIEQGWVIPTPGDTIDYNYIEQEIHAMAGRYDIQEIAFDPWKAQEIVNNLAPHFTMVAIRQQFSMMAPLTDMFEKSVLGHRLAHGRNPVLRWMMGCTEIKSDRQGYIMPMKPERHRRGKRIDGIVAWIMAHGRATIMSAGPAKAPEIMVL